MQALHEGLAEFRGQFTYLSLTTEIELSKLSPEFH
jgi:hypothetical protein